MLSGHNHGGQIRLPVLGPVFMPSIYSRRFDRGFFRSGQTLLYVSEGIGGKHPIRYGCPPEVCRFVLRSGSAHAGLASGALVGRLVTAESTRRGLNRSNIHSLVVDVPLEEQTPSAAQANQRHQSCFFGSTREVLATEL